MGKNKKEIINIIGEQKYNEEIETLVKIEAKEADLGGF